MMESFTLYYVADMDAWAWSPDGVGCYWYGSEDEARAESIEPLAMGETFDTYKEFEEFRNA